MDTLRLKEDLTDYFQKSKTAETTMMEKSQIKSGSVTCGKRLNYTLRFVLGGVSQN